jgi:metal transporter CNNM
MSVFRINTLLVCLLQAFAPLVKALPMFPDALRVLSEEGPKDPKDARLWVYLSTAIALVLLGGAFAGLTIA